MAPVNFRYFVKDDRGTSLNWTDWKSPRGLWFASDEFSPSPENYSLIDCVEVCEGNTNSGPMTEDAYKLPHQLAGRRWKRLSFGEYPLPSDMPEAVAVILAEALWYTMLMEHVKAHPMILEMEFLGALDDHPTDFGYTWAQLYELGKGDGLDYQIEALCEGVPLDYILGA